MQNIHLPHASRILRAAAGLGLLLLAGCAATLTNLTPDALPENPSQIYTISYRYVPHAEAVPGSVKVRIIIGGEGHEMVKSAVEGIYTYDYSAPAGATEVAYYILADYRSRSRSGMEAAQEDYSPLQHTKIAGRYVLELEANRGPVGARVGVVGRGFTPQDAIYLDHIPARTNFESANALSFYVPGVASGRNYSVQVTNPAGTTVTGTFRVDPSTVSVAPTALTLRQGETQALTFTLPTPASAGGLLLDVTTDVPDSVIMPDVIVAAGTTSLTVHVTGGRPGSGRLTVSGYNLSVPVTVSP